MSEQKIPGHLFARTLAMVASQLPDPRAPLTSLTLRGAAPEAFPLLPALLRECGRKELFWILTPTPDRALRLFEEIRTASSLLGQELDGVLFPEEELLPYDRESPADFIRAERIHALDRISAAGGRLDFVVAPVTAVMRHTLPPGLIQSRKRRITTGMEGDPESVVSSLLAFGYLRVPKVTAPGEFSVRGALIDLYSTDRRQPVRIEWDDWLIRSIRIFDPASQRSLAPVSSVELLPSHEWIVPDKGTGADTGEPHSLRLRNHATTPYPPGIERHVPTFFPEAASPLFHRKDLLLLPCDWPAILARIQDWRHRIEEGWDNLPDEDRQFIPPPQPGLHCVFFPGGMGKRSPLPLPRLAFGER